MTACTERHSRELLAKAEVKAKAKAKAEGEGEGEGRKGMPEEGTA